MFVVRVFEQFGIERYYCRTIEKVKELFEDAFWAWVREEESWGTEPSHHDVDSWEELLANSWEEGELEEVVCFEPLEFEEDKKTS